MTTDEPRRVQHACDRCTQGVMDADRPGRPGNDHLYGWCACPCHARHPEDLEP
jgi:hypothetical protein